MGKFTEIRALLHDRKNMQAFEEASRWLQADPQGREPRLITGYCLKNLCEEAADKADPDMFIRYYSMLPSLCLQELGQDMMPNRFAWAIDKMARSLAPGSDIQVKAMTVILDMARRYSYVKPEKYYSVLLDAAIRVKEKMEKGWTGFYDFMLWWGFDSFSLDDYKKVESSSGHKTPSLAERAHTACYHSLLMQLERKQCHLDRIKDFVAHLDSLIAGRKAFPDTALHKARLLLAIGEKERALNAARLFARFKQADFRTWDVIGDCMDDPVLRLACYCRALKCRSNPGFTVNIRLKAADLMGNLGLYPNARHEADMVKAIYDSSGWKVKGILKKIMDSDWFDDTIPADNNESLYSFYFPYAEQILK